MTGIPAALIAAYLGVTPARVRQVINADQIPALGTTAKTKLYDPTAVIGAVRTRQTIRYSTPNPTSLTLNPSDRTP